MALKPSFQVPLLRWYRRHKRDLPWRLNQDPYRILLSEIMLQQTQVQTVMPYYHRFLKRFPTFQALAKAPLDHVLKLWEGLGYYSRARNLHALAGQVSNRPDQTLPNTFDEIIKLPGIGRYTAGAVLSIAYDQDVPLVDGNVQRVFARFFGITSDITLPATQREMWTRAEDLLVRGHAGDYNQALMELGALICTPKTPACPTCPVRKDCVARQKNLQSVLPVKKKKGLRPHQHVGAAVIWKGDWLLISQRPLKGLLGGLWEFPGGKLEPGETIEHCIKREIKEELDVTIKVGPELAQVEHAYSHYSITLHVHTCRFIRGTPKKLGVKDWKWIKPPELKRYAFPAANQGVIEKLLQNKSSSSRLCHNAV